MPACPTVAHFTTHFALLPDPRVERTKRHQLIDILVIALCATLCGADDFVAITDWGRAKRNWLQERLGLELKNGIPRHDTFGRVFARLDPPAFAPCFVAWTQAVKTHTKGQVIALWTASNCVTVSTRPVTRPLYTWSGRGLPRAGSCWPKPK